MRYERVRELPDERFYRLTGLRRTSFDEMVLVLEEAKRKREAGYKHRGGRKHRMTVPDKLLLTLEYWREYRTMFHISESYNLSEPSVWRAIRWVEDTLITSGKFTLPGKKALRTEEVEYDVLVIDATETPCERPKKRAKAAAVTRGKRKDIR